MSRRLLFALLLPAVYGCDPADPCSVAATVEPALEVGVGERAFRSVEEGDRLELEWGGQGGRHVWVGVRTEGVATGRQGLFSADDPGPDVAWTLTSADGVQVGSGGSYGQALKGDETGAELVGQELYIEWWGPETGAAEPDFSSLILRAELADHCGAELIDEVSVRAEL